MHSLLQQQQQKQQQQLQQQAIDYIGESGIGNSQMTPSIEQRAYEGDPWSVHIANCGDLDIVGRQKPQSLCARCSAVVWFAAGTF